MLTSASQTFQARNITRTQIIAPKYSSEGTWEASARCDAEGNSDVVNTLDVILCLDYSIEAITWANCRWDSDADYSGAREGEEGCCYGGGGKMHFGLFDGG